MDDKGNADIIDREETASEDVEVEIARRDKTPRQNEAGPSDYVLPGEVPELFQSNLQSKTGISKSEHSIRHIITTKDVANALKSLNINSNNQLINNELKIPVIGKDGNQEKDPTTFVDLKKFMATCFKINKDPPGDILLSNMRKQNVQTIPVITGEVIEDIPNTSCNQVLPNAEDMNKTTEVLLSDSKFEDRPANVIPEKNKTSGNYGLAPRDSLSSIGSNVCRICMTRGRERLISPCNCKGSLANVHLTCLERWLNQVGRNHCELCGYSYPAIRTPRYTILQALRLWFGNPRNRSHLQSDCLIFWLLSTVTAGLLAVCIVGTQYFVIEGNKFGISHRITETAMDFFMAIVLCGYSVTVYLLWKDHYMMWNRWRRANVNVRLLLSPDANPVPFVPRPQYDVV